MKQKTTLLILTAIVALLHTTSGAEEKEEPKIDWKSSISFGTSYRKTTVSKTGGTLNIRTSRYSKKCDWISSLYGSYGETEGLQTDGQLRGKSDFRYKLSGNNTFYGGLYTEAYHNAVRDVALRLRFGPNLGYYFIYRDSLKFDASAGSTITYEKANDETKSFGSIRLAGTYDHKISDTTTYYITAEYNMSLEDSADNDGSLITGLKTKVTKNVSFNLEFRDQYENSAGSQSPRNDITLTTGISCDFG